MAFPNLQIEVLTIFADAQAASSQLVFEYLSDRIAREQHRERGRTSEKYRVLKALGGPVLAHERERNRKNAAARYYRLKAEGGPRWEALCANRRRSVAKWKAKQKGKTA